MKVQDHSLFGVLKLEYFKYHYLMLRKTQTIDNQSRREFGVYLLLVYTESQAITNIAF